MKLPLLPSRALHMLLLAMTVIGQGISVKAHALPYDCPGTSTDLRKQYVCKMASKVGPDFWNQWGQIRSKTIASYKRFQAGRSKCTSGCETKLTRCKETINQRCKTQKCITERMQTCQMRSDNCQNSCQAKSYQTNMRGMIRRGRPLANTLEYECEFGATAKTCEKEEAKPFCSTLKVPISNYQKALGPSESLIGPAVDAFVAMMNATGVALNKRLSELSRELKTGQYECAEDDKTVQNQAAGEDNACILPQYKFNIPLAALQEFSDPHQQGAVPLKAKAPSELPSAFETGGPQLDLLGVTAKYCWDKKTCSDNFKLVQPYGPGQISNYFGLPIGAARTLHPGNVVAIGGQEFTIKCIDPGALTGGSTACRSGWGTPASFDIVIVEDSDRPTQQFTTGSCVSLVNH